MSLQVNLSSKEIKDAYEDVVNANGIDWAIFTYEKGSNDLKVQATGDGGLEELEEEFSDGRSVLRGYSYTYCFRNLIFLVLETRIQYAFTRVVDPNVRVIRSSLTSRLRLFNRANCPSLFKSTGVVTAYRKQRRAYSTLIRAQ